MKKKMRLFLCEVDDQGTLYLYSDESEQNVREVCSALASWLYKTSKTSSFPADVRLPKGWRYLRSREHARVGDMCLCSMPPKSRWIPVPAVHVGCTPYYITIRKESEE